METGETTTTTTTASPAQGDQPTVTAGTAQPAQTAAQTTGAQPPAATAAADAPDKTAATTDAQPKEGADKPFLGDKPKGDGEGDKPKGDADQPQPPTEEDYLKAVTKDETLLGKDDNLVFDQALVKSVIPVCQKHGISTEAAKELANAFAKQQIEGARAAFKERADRFSKMNAEARAKYSDADFQQINKGIDACFKPGGVMNHVIRNSELGSDPEFLALMHRLGAENREDTGKGAATAAGDAGGDADGIGGISKIW